MNNTQYSTPAEIEKMSIADFLTANKEEIRNSLDSVIKPTFEGLSNPTKYKQEVELLHTLSKKPFERQARAIVASVEHLKKHKSLILSAEMGTGKTLMAISMAFIRMRKSYNGRMMRFGIMCPTHLLGKWKAEIEEVLGQYVNEVTIHIVSKGEQLLHIERNLDRKGKKAVFYIFSKECAKLGYTINQDFIGEKLVCETSKGEIFHHCKACGTQYTQEEVESFVKNSFDKYRYFTNVYSSISKVPPRERFEVESRRGKGGVSRGVTFCRNCSIKPNKLLLEKRFSLFAQGKHIPIAEEGIKRKLSIEKAIKSLNTKGFFEIFFCDEMHEMKSGDSAQGLTFGTLIQHSKNAVGLTGTLLNGYVSSLFHLLYRMFPYKMVEMGFSHSASSLFVERFGGYETKERMSMDEYQKSGSQSRRRTQTNKKNTKEIPVINPELIKFLMPNIIFLKQDDMNIELPDYEERVEFSLPDINPQYQQYIAELYSIISNKDEPNGKKLLGAFANDSLSILDLPFVPVTREYKIMVGATESVKHIKYEPTFKETSYTNKERKLYKLVKEEIAKGRKVLVYVSFSGLGTDDRVAKVLKEMLSKDQGVLMPKIEVLHSSVEAKKRDDWIKKHNPDVLITNPELVKTGLDLYDYPTIIFHQTDYKIQTIKQASRRAWRIGQKEKCKVIYLVSKGTSQQTALSLIAKKIKASNDLEGKICLTGKDLTSLVKTQEDDLQKAILKVLSNGEALEINNEDLEVWKFEKRDRDVFETYVVEMFAKLDEEKKKSAIDNEIKQEAIFEVKAEEVVENKSDEVVKHLKSELSDTSTNDTKEVEMFEQNADKKVVARYCENDNQKGKLPKRGRKKKEVMNDEPNLFSFYGIEL